jgi:chemotaxis protein methyltransferase CheR
VVLLDKLTPHVQHTLHATDLDRKILAKAHEGVFSEADVKNVEPMTLMRYFNALPKSGVKGSNPFARAYQLKPEFRQRVTFRQHNLLADKFEGDYDLICCRNVVIYFTDEAKDRLYSRFATAMRLGGYLFVGGTERIAQSREIGLDSPISFFYRRKR